MKNSIRNLIITAALVTGIFGIVVAEEVESSTSIKDEIDLEFSQEISTKTLSLDNWKNEDEVLDALSESNRINNIDNENIEENDKSDLNKKPKNKKKKRFFFF